MDTLTITEELNKLDYKTLASRIPELFANSSEIQKSLLMQIIKANTSCEYGKKYHFDEIKTIDDYRRLVPITFWKDYEPYSERLVAGENGLLFTEDVKQFLHTSGTTGNGKFIPESRMSDVARSLVLKLRQFFDAKAVPQILALLNQAPKAPIKGRLLSLANVSADENKTPYGTPIVYASAQTIKQSKLNDYFAFPAAVHKITDNDAKDYLIMRFAIETPDVWAISGNNANRLTHLIKVAESQKDNILSDIERGTIDFAGDIDLTIKNELLSLLKPNRSRAEELRRALQEGKEFIPSTYWPNLMLALFWLSASVGRYIADVRPLLPKTTRFMDVGYGASEAKFNIPIKPEDPAGALSIATTFFEFLPIGGSETLLAHQLKVGEKYELIITTWGGLYRYNMLDIVACKGYTGNTPLIEFISKSVEIINICDEKVYPCNIIDSTESVLSDYGKSLKYVQVYGDSQARYYHLYIESDDDVDMLNHTEFEKKLHNKLYDLALGYKIFSDAKVIHPLKVTFMKKGWQESLINERLNKGVSLTQIKLPTVIQQRANEEWFLN